MTLEEIQKLWSKDADIDRIELGEEALKISQLHSKYYKIFSTERLVLKKTSFDLISLKQKKREYYLGLMDPEELHNLGWEPQPLQILKADVGEYISADEDVIQAELKKEYQKEKVDFVENIIKSLVNRGFNIKAAIDWEKFKVGL